MAEIYLNGAYVAAEQATVSVMDRGFLFADGVYEVIPCYGGRPLGVDRHLERLGRSLAGIGMRDPLGRDAWQAVFARLLAAAPDTDQAIYLQITRGAAPVRDHRFPAASTPTVVAMSKPLPPRAPSIAEHGVRAILCEDIRWSRCDIKAIGLLAAVLLRQQAAEAGAEEAILYRDGQVTEGSTSNVFVVAGDCVMTPPTSPRLLSGITRDLLAELLREAGIECMEQAVPVPVLQQADEVWITSSTREVAPVTAIGGQPVGTGVPGPLWREADRLYQDYKMRLRSGHV
jgi:D-alanine transaminase